MTAVPSGVRGSSSLDAWLHEHGEGLVAIRRQLHANPELSGQEHATTETVAARLELAGLAPRRLAVGTGLICEVDGVGTPRLDGAADDGGVTARDPAPQGPVLALRADLDALAMDDEKVVHYRSQTPGVAHACGHDVHTTVVLGTALYLAHHREELAGRVRFLFQPAEERVPGGALDVIADGGITGVDAVMGLHCEPKMDVGTVGLTAGPVSSAADMARISLTGPGGHTARPEMTVDLIRVAARVVAQLPARVGELLGAPELVKVVFGAVHAGDAANVIPGHCELRASVRTPSLETWERLPEVVDRAVREVVGDSGAEHRLDYTHGVPPVVNDGAVIDLIERAAVRALGRTAIVPATQSWGGDDFAWYTRQVPGAYVRLGVHDPAAGPPLDLHAGHFDVDERAIELGVRLLVAAVEEYFAST